MNQSLIDQLLNWDGIHTDYLIQIYQQHQQLKSFFTNLVDICLTRPDLQIPASWLIKNHYDNKHSLDHALINKLMKEGRVFEHWEARLHLLQILPKVKLDLEVVPYIEEWVRRGLKEENKFIRAWSYQGLYEVSKYIPELKEEVALLCEDALQIENASVKARVRKVVKQLRENG